MSFIKHEDPKIQGAVDLFLEEKRHHIQGELLFLALHGSHAYGSAHKDSDVDLSGVFIAPIDDFIGMGSAQQTFDSQSSDVYDIYMHEVGKFFRLAAQGNPNAIEVLWGPPLYVHPHFESVIDNRDKFLSQEFISRCKGFANAQMGRIKRGNKGGKINNHKREKHAFHIFRLLKMALQVAQGEPTNGLIVVKDPDDIRDRIKKTDNAHLIKWMEVMIEKIDEQRHSDKNDLPDKPDLDLLHHRLLDLRYNVEADAIELDHLERLILEDLA